MRRVDLTLCFKLKVGKVTNLESLEKNKVVKQTVEVDGDNLEADLVISCIGSDFVCLELAKQ